jgi:hypothetical protein
VLYCHFFPTDSAVHLSGARRLARDSLILTKGTIPPGESLVANAALSRAALARALVI